MKGINRILGILMSVSITVASVFAPINVSAEAKSEPENSVFEHYITVDNTKLMDGDEELKFVSLNYPQATSDNAWEHANALKTIKAMGGNVTRTYTIPVFNGGNSGKAYVKGVDENGQLIFDEAALNALDDVLAKANQYGIRVIIPLVDHWHWIGGIDGYVWMAGESEGEAPSSSGFKEWAWKFYSSDTCMDYFKQMIAHLLERTNTVSGVKYKEDKAILCFETGNEMGNRSQEEKDDILTSWTNEVTDYIHSLDNNHLVLDGRMSMSEKSLSEENHADILGAHYYEGNYAARCEDDTRAAHRAGKPFILGEFGAKVTAEPCIEVFQKGLENGTNGIMMWSLRAHKDGYGYYFHDEDGYWAAYHWPGFVAGDYYGETDILRAIYAYAQIANGNANNYEEAKLLPIPAPEREEAPLLYAPMGVSHDRSFLNDSVGDIKWRGVVGGAWYEIQRYEGLATVDTPEEDWQTIAGEADYVYDSGRNWEDKAHDCICGYHDETAIDGRTYSYRLRACNESGVGLWSNIVTVNNTKHVVVDELDLIAVASNDANPTELRRTYSNDHSANIEYSSSSIVNKSGDEGYMEYKAMIPVEEIEVTALSETEEQAAPKIMVSKDGITYEELPVIHENGTKKYIATNVTSQGTFFYSRIYIAGESKCKLDTIAITYKNNGNSYLVEAEGAKVSSNVMIQDNTFGEGANPYYVKKDANLSVFQGTEGKGLSNATDTQGSIVYKTGDDINAYRIVVLSQEKTAKVEYSYDGVSFVDAAVLSQGQTGAYTRRVYGDLNVTKTIRVLRITLPEKSNDQVLLESVELSSGTKTIPLAENAPANSIEDGEYYFGENEKLSRQYRVEALSNGVAFEKNLGHQNYEAYDCVYAWMKADNSGNTLALKFTDASDNVWVSDAVALTGTVAKMCKFEISKASSFDWSDVTKVEFVIQSSASITNPVGSITLDSNYFYSGNYGVALRYGWDGFPEKTLYVDSVYVSSSTKVDDFEGYSGSNTLLNQAYSRNTNGGAFDLSLDATNKSEGAYGLRVDYDYEGKGYAGATKQMDLLNLSGYDGFTMFVNSDGSNNEIKVQMETNRSTYAYTGYLTGKGPMTLYMPFEKIIEPSWATSGTPSPIDSSENLKSVSIYTNQNGGVTKGTFYVDDLKGANFVSALEGSTTVSMDTISDSICAFPYEIKGEAAYVKYIALTIGSKVYNVPVGEDGKWTYILTEESGIYNGEDIEVKAGFYYPDGEVIKEAEVQRISLNVEGNDAPVIEAYDQAIWTWDFAADGTSGWQFDGFIPWVENGNLVAWTQNAFDGEFSYTIENVPNGVYTLQNDIKVKSNMNLVEVALISGDDEVKSSPIDTADVLEEDKLIGKKLTVFNHKITVKYYVAAPTDANGATFAVGDLKLFYVEGNNVVKNADFSQTAPCNGGWPNYPTDWRVTPYDNNGAVKTEPVWYEAGNNKVMVVGAGAFAIEQDVEILSADAGVYNFSINIDATNGGSGNASIEDLYVEVKEKNGQTVKKLLVSNEKNGKVELTNLTLESGEYTVAVTGTLVSGTVYVDDAVLVLMTPFYPNEKPEVEPENVLVNGDFSELNEEWPNLPVAWNTSYEGGDGWSPIKGEAGVFVGYADNGYSFTLSQDAPSLNGIYKVSAQMSLLNDGYVKSVILSVGDTKKDVTSQLEAGVFKTVSLEEIEIHNATVKVSIQGDFSGKGIKIDNVKMVKTGEVSDENPEGGNQAGEDSEEENTEGGNQPEKDSQGENPANGNTPELNPGTGNSSSGADKVQVSPSVDKTDSEKEEAGSIEKSDGGEKEEISAEKPDDKGKKDNPTEKSDDGEKKETSTEKSQDGELEVGSTESKKVEALAEASAPQIFRYGSFFVKNGTAVIKSVHAKTKKIAIPGKVVDQSGAEVVVSKIGKNAFKGNNTVTTIVLPKSIQYIGNNAFHNCKMLKKITITSTKLTDKSLAKGAFKGVKKGTVIVVPKKKLKAYKRLFAKKGLSSKVVIKAN